MPTDAELLQAYAKFEDNDAFHELVRRHIDLVYSAAVRRVGGDLHLANDVTQHVFTALARDAKNLTARPSLAGWLYTAARFAAAQVVRSERRRKAREREASSMSENISPDQQWEQLRPWMESAMDQLRDPDREAIVLRFFQGKTHQAIGRELRLTEEAARKRVDRALEKLRVQLARRGVQSSSAAVALLLGQNAISAAPAPFAATIAAGALTAAANFASPTLGIFQLMSATKLTTTIITLAAIFCAGIASREIHAARVTQAELEKVNQTTTALRQERDEAERAIRQREQNLAVAEESRAAKMKVNAIQPPGIFLEGDRLPPGVINPVEAGQEFLKAHPEAARLLADYNRYRWLDRYQNLFSKLSFTSAQIDQFINVMRHTDAGVAWQSLNQVPMVEFNADAEGITREERNAQLHELMGEAGFRALQEYDRSFAARQLTAQLGEVFYATPNALTGIQGDQLMEIFAHNSPEFQAGRAASTTSVNWDHALGEAQTILNPAQWSALSALRQQIEFRETLKAAANAAENQAVQTALKQKKLN